MPIFLRRAYAALIHCFVIELSGLAIWTLYPLCEALIVSLVEGTRFRDDHPGNAGDLGSDGYDCLIRVHSGFETLHPGPQPISLSVKMRVA